MKAVARRPLPRVVTGDQSHQCLSSPQGRARQGGGARHIKLEQTLESATQRAEVAAAELVAGKDTYGKQMSEILDALERLEVSRVSTCKEVLLMRSHRCKASHSSRLLQTLHRVRFRYRCIYNASDYIDRSALHEAGVSDSYGAGSWVQIASNDGESNYYYNEETGETTWDRPSALGGASDDADHDDEEGGEWREEYSDDGRKFYYNASTNETRWEL